MADLTERQSHSAQDWLYNQGPHNVPGLFVFEIFWEKDTVMTTGDELFSLLGSGPFDTEVSILLYDMFA